MKIAIISSGIVNINTFLKEQIKVLLEKHNAKITIITNTGVREHLYKELKNLNVKIINISFERKPNLLIDIITFFNLLKILKKSDFDLTLTVTPKAGLLGCLASFLKKIPIRIHIFTGQVWVNKTGIVKFFLKQADRIIYNLSTKSLIDSKSQKEFLLKEKIVRDLDSDVILNGSICGVDITKFKPNPAIKNKVRKDINVKDTDTILLFIGRLNRDKGVFDLILAFNSLSKKFKNLKLLMVGSDEENFIEFLNKNYPNLKDKVIIKNFTLETEKYYICSDIFIMPSYREGFGLASIEASSCGLPVIATNIYGLNDSVKNGFNGFLHEPGEVTKLELLISNLLNNKNYTDELGKNGRKLVQEKFTQNKVVNFFCSYLENINKNFQKKNFFMCGTFSHSIYNFRGELISELQQKDFNVIGFGSDTTKEDIKEIKKLKINFHDYNIDNSSINLFKDIFSFLILSYYFLKYKPKYALCYTIKAVIMFGILKKVFKVNFKSFALITGVGNVFVSKNYWFKKFVKIFYRTSLMSYNKVFFQNNDDRLFFLSEKLIKEDKSTETFRGSGVNIQKFNSKTFPTKITFSLASRMIENKGINEFCEVARRIKKENLNIEFLICGDFTNSRYSLDKEKTLNMFAVSGVKYSGWVKNMKEFYEKTSVYVLPSKREGTPRTVLEAMAMNKPIITNDVPGCRDTIENSYNGFLSKLGDINDLEDKFKMFISNPDLIEEMGKNSRTRVEDLYDVKKINHKMIYELLN